MTPSSHRPHQAHQQTYSSIYKYPETSHFLSPLTHVPGFHCHCCCISNLTSALWPPPGYSKQTTYNNNLFKGRVCHFFFLLQLLSSHLFKRPCRICPLFSSQLHLCCRSLTSLWSHQPPHSSSDTPGTLHSQGSYDALLCEPGVYCPRTLEQQALLLPPNL